MRTLLISLLCWPVMALAQSSYPAGAGLVLHYSNGAAPCVPTTPIAPTGTADNDSKTISASHALGSSEILVKIGSAGFVQYTGTISVANADLPAGYYQFKTKAADCRNESPVWQSPAFTYSNPSQAQAAPTFRTEYPQMQMLEFSAPAGRDNLSHFEFSTNGTTWTTLTDSIAYKYIWESGAWGGRQIRVFVGNAAHAIGTVSVRTKAADGYAASAAVSNAVAYPLIGGFDRYKPLFYTGANGVAQNLIDVIEPAGVGVLWKAFEFTTDGGTTAVPFGSLPQWIPNKTYAANKIGVRTINPNDGSPRSGWHILSSGLDSIPETAYTVSGLKEYNPAVLGTIADGDSILTLNSNAYGFAPNQYIGIGNSGTAGGGLRGTRGTGKEWPYESAPDSAYFVAHNSSYPAGTYGWTHNDGRVRRKGDDGSWTIYSTLDPDKDLSMPIAARRKILQVTNGGLTLKLDKPVYASATATHIYFDNSPVLNEYRANRATNSGDPYYYANVTVPAGTYPILSYVVLGGTGVKVNAGGVTLFSPACFTSASVDFMGYGAQLNPTGSGWFTVKGNYARQGVGFPAYDDNYNKLLPVTEPWATEYYLNAPGIRLGVKSGTARNIEAWDNIYYAVQAYGCLGLKISGVKARHTSITDVLNAGYLAYYGGYAWFIHTSSSNNVTWDFLNDTCFTSPRHINAIEAFNSKYVGYYNGIIKNGYGAFNGSSNCTAYNMRFDIDSNAGTFQTSGFPLLEGNNFVNFSGDVSKNRYEKLSFTLRGPLFGSVPNSYPVGLLVRSNDDVQANVQQTGSAGIIVKNITYSRPAYDVSQGNGGWYGAAIKVPALGAVIDSVTATGNFTNAYLNVWGINESAGASVDIAGTGAVISNVNVPTAHIPVGNTLTNVLTTERTIAEPCIVSVEANKTISTLSTTLTKTAATQFGAGKTQSSQTWTCVYASLGDRFSVTFTNPNADSCTAANMQHGGVYAFQLAALDNTGTYGKGFVVVTVQ